MSGRDGGVRDAPAPGAPAGDRGRGAPRDGGARFWVCAAVGLGIVAFGLAGLLRDVHGPALASWAKLLLGGLALHDGLAAPLVALAGVALARLLPARVRAPLQGALVVSALVLVVALPVVDGAGRLPGNPSLLPSHRYGAHLLAVLAVVWLAALALVVRAAFRKS